MALVVVVVAGVVSVKYLETPRGKVFLLDRGFSDYYSQVQDTLDVELRRVIRELGLERNLKETSRAILVRGNRFATRRWVTSCDQACSLFRVNLALTEATQRVGGVVRSSREVRAGEVLRIEVGSQKFTTLRIDVHQTTERSEKTSPPEPTSKIALVIDDFGYSKDEIAEAFLDIDLPLTFSVIPTLPYSGYVLSRVVESGKQAILHLPMEAENSVYDVEPVLTSMSDREIASLVEMYIGKTPGIIGINNHMGSVATQDLRVMKTVLGVIRTRDLFFLDSLTSSKSIAYNTAKDLGVPTARNDLFLDADTEEQEVVEARLERLIDIARTRGFAVGIGHPKPWTFNAVKSYEELLKNSDIKLVFLSALVE
ncbi:MAG: divergent polysaccharide deacetylase family protein [Candidatus Latescibacterota bacterium]|nr:MAG: divergent polysaccharide deacetylase family protein [Candidatus Latescibacterota bacterium]